MREKRTTLEALLVLEKEEMTDLQKAHEDLQSSLVRLATEKEQLVRDMYTPIDHERDVLIHATENEHRAVEGDGSRSAGGEVCPLYGS